MQAHKFGPQVLPCILCIYTPTHVPMHTIFSIFQFFIMNVFVISSGVIVSLAMGIKFLIPFIFHIWSIILPWLNPPFLYIIINCIIIAIAASSRFHKITSSPSPELDSFPVQSEITTVAEPPLLVYEGDDKIVEVKPVLLNGSKVEEQETDADADADADVESDDEEDVSFSMYTQPQKIIHPEVHPDFLLPATFGQQKPIRANRKGARTPRVPKPKRRETLEGIWKTITDGRNVQPTKHLEKSDTWDHRGHHIAISSPYQMSKSKAFKDGTNRDSQLEEAPTSLSLSTQIRKQLSPGQDELNRRAEAFINKVNEDMRLQRQESLDNFMEMINRGI